MGLTETDEKTRGGGLKTPSMCSEWAHGGIRIVSGPLEQCGALKSGGFFYFTVNDVFPGGGEGDFTGGPSLRASFVTESFSCS